MNRLVLLPLLFLPAFAAEISWTASGSVSSVAGSGFAATVSEPVTVKFSYSSDVLIKVSDYFPIGNSVNAKSEFYGDINLTVEVTIGESTWKGSVPNSTVDGTLALYTNAWVGNGPSDVFTVLASSGDGGTFSPFPYTGASVAREMKIDLRDGTTPAEFINISTLPSDSAIPCNLTAGSGFVGAGGDRINFTIDPKSVTVETDEPRIPLTLTRTLTGIELRWPSENGVSYRLDESDDICGWKPMGSYFGTGSEILVPLNPFEDHPEGRFYRVVTE